MFFVVTLVVTLPYTYYHASLLAAAAVVTGVIFGELWQRSGHVTRGAALAAILISLLLLDRSYYRECVQQKTEPSLRAQVLQYLEKNRAAAWYVPFELVPPLHYYRPEATAVGYNPDWSVERLASESSAAGARVVCGETLCHQLEDRWGHNQPLGSEPLGRSPDNPETVYVVWRPGP
jgi:hypothetical protein